MFQAMHLGLYLEWEPNFETGKLELRQNKTRISEKIVISYFQRVGPQCNVEIFTEQVRREKRMLVELKAFVDWQHSVWGYWMPLSLLSKSGARVSLNEEKIQRVSERETWTKYDIKIYKKKVIG